MQHSRNYLPLYFGPTTDAWGMDLNEANSNQSRTFEELITERGEDFDGYSKIFEKIRDVLFVSGESEDVDLLQHEKDRFSKKYNIPLVENTISTFKQNLYELYNRKIELSILIEEKRRLLKTFCTNIGECIQSITTITSKSGIQGDDKSSNISSYKTLENIPGPRAMPRTSTI